MRCCAPSCRSLSDAAALCVGGHDDPASRCPDLVGRLVEPLNGRTEVDDEATVVDRQLQRGGDRRDDAGVGDEGLVVAQRADRLGAPRPATTRRCPGRRRGSRRCRRTGRSPDPVDQSTRRAAVAQGPDHEVVEQAGLGRGLGDARGRPPPPRRRDRRHPTVRATRKAIGIAETIATWTMRTTSRTVDARVGVRDRDAAGDHGDGEDAVPEEGKQLPSDITGEVPRVGGWPGRRWRPMVVRPRIGLDPPDRRREPSPVPTRSWTTGGTRATR